MAYTHTQSGPLSSLLIIPAIACGLSGAALWSQGPIGLLLILGAVLLLFLAACFHSLTITDRGDHLAVRYGPIPLFGTRIRYDTIASAEPGRSAIIDGWGIHFVPGRGWTFNLWGRDCVVLRGHGRTIRLGTDDPLALATFIQSRASAASPAHPVQA